MQLLCLNSPYLKIKFNGNNNVFLRNFGTGPYITATHCFIVRAPECFTKSCFVEVDSEKKIFGWIRLKKKSVSLFFIQRSFRLKRFKCPSGFVGMSQRLENANLIVRDWVRSGLTRGSAEPTFRGTTCGGSVSQKSVGSEGSLILSKVECFTKICNRYQQKWLSKELA